ncbi:MAG: hypothetical protein ACI9P7_000688 [Candidatus Azotimanducaceae bacterium]|jgi:hypothetical protein
MYALHNHNKMIDHDSCYYSPPLDHSLVSFRFVSFRLQELPNATRPSHHHHFALFDPRRM